jgi:O-antigen/teichoic acid export membrane protein
VIAVLFGQGAISLTSFITLLALGRWAGQEALGVFVLGWSCWFLASSLVDTLVTTPYTYFKLQHNSSGALNMICVWGAILLSLGFAIALTALWLLNVSAFGALWPALPIALSASLLREITRRVFLATSQTKHLLWLDTTSSLLQLIGLGVLCAWNQLSAAYVLWLIAVSTIIPILPMLNVARLRRLFTARSQTKEELLKFYRYGRWLLVGGMFHVLSVQAYPWLAFVAGGTKLTGLYAACMSIVNILAPLLIGLTNYFRPKFMFARVRYPGQGFPIYVVKRTAIFIFPGLVLCLLLIPFGESTLLGVYGPAFREGAMALAWFGGGALAVCLAAPFQLGLLALNATVTNLYYHAMAGFCVLLGALLYLGSLTLVSLGVIYFVACWTACALLIAMFFTRESHGRDLVKGGASPRIEI